MLGDIFQVKLPKFVPLKTLSFWKAFLFVDLPKASCLLWDVRYRELVTLFMVLTLKWFLRIKDLFNM